MFFVLVLSALAATVAVATPVRHEKAHHAKPSHPRSEAHPAAHHYSEHTSKGLSHPRAEHLTEQHHSEHPNSRHVKRPAALRSRSRRGVRLGSGAPTVARLERASFRRSAMMSASPLKGSLESLEHQNEMAESEGLERILDENDLENRIAEKLLVPVPVSDALTINPELPENHRYCRPWTADFLRDLARAHDKRFHRPLDVSSAVRTVEYQKRLMRINGNAAAAEGDIVSPHLTGATIDIAKSGMTREELNWMRTWLLRLQVAGQIDVEEEFRQACFHITVYKSYDVPADEPTIRKAGRQSEAAAPDDPGGQ